MGPMPRRLHCKFYFKFLLLLILLKVYSNILRSLFVAVSAKLHEIVEFNHLFSELMCIQTAFRICQ